MKVCFVGTGSIGRRHIKNLCSLLRGKGEKAVIHALRSSGRELDGGIKGQIAKECFGVCELDMHYDAIFIANPTHLHYETLIKLKDKSNHFFIEKPVFDRTNVDLETIKKEFQGKLCYVACPLRHSQVLGRAKAILDGEAIYSVRAVCSSYLPDWRQGADYRDTYSAHKEQGGGVRIDLIHEWDYLSYLFGMPQTVRQLFGTYSHLEIDSEDIAVYIASYPDKLLELHLDYFGRQTRRAMEVLTKDACWVFDIANNSILKNGIMTEMFDEAPNDKYMQEMDFFYRLMGNGTENTNTVEHAVEVMKIAYSNDGADWQCKRGVRLYG